MNKYTVLADEGVTLESGEVIAKGETVELTEEQAQPLLDTSSIEAVEAE